MSVSLKLKRAIDVARAMGHDRAIMPPNKSFTSKHQNMQCRRCGGAGVDKEKGGACPQCLGKGSEKLSLKTIIKHMKKLEAAGLR